MGLLEGLGKFNRAMKKIDNAEKSVDNFKKENDKSTWTDDDRKCNRRATWWCWLNMLAAAVIAVGLYFLFGLLFSELFLAPIFGTIVLVSGLAWSLRKCMTYVDDNCVGWGIKLLAKISFLVSVLAIVAVVLVKILFGMAW